MKERKHGIFLRLMKFPRIGQYAFGLLPALVNLLEMQEKNFFNLNTYLFLN